MNKINIIELEIIVSAIVGAIAVYLGIIETNLLGAIFLLFSLSTFVILLDKIFDIKWIKTPNGVTYI